MIKEVKRLVHVRVLTSRGDCGADGRAQYKRKRALSLGYRN